MDKKAFEWDDNKNLSNIAKHGLNFEEASELFDDNYRLTIPDHRNDYGELRKISIGQITLSSLQTIIIIVVVHTDRNDVIRIISARKAKKKEREAYEKGKPIF
ncbi:BrnT family toxin [Nostoc sp. HG1]|nr:BrnT family toxin [Nostoc sp. HG1]MCL6749924.1 BrnT family toxin [Nostoc sp. CCCryo 231-06]